MPPPCIYLFPRTIPDPRNNPEPPVWNLNQLKFLERLARVFGVRDDEITKVHIHARMEGANVQRKTVLARGNEVVGSSEWTTIQRASR